ncbi:unnamed protein product [Peniophora sp. CBMAI 1063]|nr:unnamed protein product [Peniophora sp. CBMAI 1063]
MPSSKPAPTPATWSYFLIRLLFRFVLKVFYGTIVVEGAEHIPPKGHASIITANHANSLTDALLLVTSIPYKKRGMLRLTAKSTQFGRRTFTSWLIESAGTLPIKRRKDFGDQDVDNSMIMAHLIDSLGRGDAVALFPEGASRYHPTIAPLKTGVIRLVSDTLTAHAEEPDFSVSVVPCSITYMHRQHFRSDVLVSFHPPLSYTPRDNPDLLAPIKDYSAVRRATTTLGQRIASGTLDAPRWSLVRAAKLAATIYAPLGTRMALGDYVRLSRDFLQAMKAGDTGTDGESAVGTGTEDGNAEDAEQAEEMKLLLRELKAYGGALTRLHIKDDRIRQPLARPVILCRLALRFTWALTLFILSFPGLLLWAPVIVTTFIAVKEFKKTGPIWDTWDEIAQYKLVYGLISGLCVWGGAVLLTLPLAPITFWLVPAVMWMSLRWFEDAVAAARAFVALARLFLVSPAELNRLRALRAELHTKLMALAMAMGLPEDPEKAYAEGGEAHKGRTGVGSGWRDKTRYFSVRRRRKREWDETLRLQDQDEYDYPSDWDS